MRCTLTLCYFLKTICTACLHTTQSKQAHLPGREVTQPEHDKTSTQAAAAAFPPPHHFSSLAIPDTITSSITKQQQPSSTT
jgi:hypothetical protein